MPRGTPPALEPLQAGDKVTALTQTWGEEWARRAGPRWRTPGVRYDRYCAEVIADTCQLKASRDYCEPYCTCPSAAGPPGAAHRPSGAAPSELLQRTLAPDFPPF